MRAGLIILAGLAVVALGLFGLSSSDPQLLELAENDPSRVTEIVEKRVITPQVYDVETTSTKIGSSDLDSRGTYDVKEFDAPDLLPGADAQSEELRFKSWRLAVHANYAFDSDGNLFAGSGHEIARVDTSNNEQTVWKTPVGSDVRGGGTTDSSGNYYFVNFSRHSNLDNLAKLDVTTDVFTQYDVNPARTLIHSDGHIYFNPSRTLYIDDENNDLNINYIAKSTDRLYIEGGNASGRIHVELTLPSDEVITRTTFVNSEAIFVLRISNLFSTDYQIQENEAGNYTVRITDMHGQTAEKTVNFAETDGRYVIHGNEPKPTTTKRLFLQSLNPVDSVVTNYIINIDERIVLIASDDSGALYFRVYLDDGYGLAKFTPGTNQIIHWPDAQVDYKITIIGDNAYWGNHIGRDTLNIVNLNMGDGSIEEISAPYECRDRIYQITSDGQNVFFNGCNNKLYKFDPLASQIPFTEFRSYYLGHNYLDSDSSGTIYLTDGGEMGILESPEIRIQDIVIDSPTQFRIVTNDALTGTPNADDFSVEQSLIYAGLAIDQIIDKTISDVRLSGDSIIITLASPLSVFGDVDVSYSGDNLESAERYLYGFTESFTDFDSSDAFILSENPPVAHSNFIEFGSYHVTGSSTASDYAVSDNTVERVDVRAYSVFLYVGTPIESDDVVKISYNGTSLLHDGRVVKEFTDIRALNTIDPTDGSG